MRRALGGFLALALVAGAAAYVHRPAPAVAQGGGTIEATVTYNGAPQVETLKVNKDTEQCGSEDEEPSEAGHDWTWPSGSTS